MMSHFPSRLDLEKLASDMKAAPNFDAYFMRYPDPSDPSGHALTLDVLDAEGEHVCTCPDDETADLLVRCLDMLFDLLQSRLP